MPGGDGTGPLGQGPRSGGGFGFCYPGAGFGRGRGYGRRGGMHCGRWRMQYGDPTLLENELAFLKTEMEAIQARLGELKNVNQ
ncbi:MAG: DUF5320 domain-containing protein [Candidatus Eremiobacteraeota bacterium]|nr:DUF5320 domain-containing protein [Candidatus Eremiobacteraeota bacterium]